MVKKTRLKNNPWVFLLLLFLLTGFNGVHRKSLHIVFIGDSITYGARVDQPEKEAPPVIAAAVLRKMPLIKSVQFYNAGKSGATTVDFLPGTKNFSKVVKAADQFYKTIEDTFSENSYKDILIFSIMLGTNDSAIEGPNGAPVSKTRYAGNLKMMIDSLLTRYPTAKFVIHKAPWYSENTYNGSKYLKEGLDRLVSYNTAIDSLIQTYQTGEITHVFPGDQSAFPYFKKHHKKKMAPENGQQGIFYLHPNVTGSAVLGKKWAKMIYKASLIGVM